MADMADQVLMTARWVVGHENGSHVLHEDGEVVFEGHRIVFVGQRFPGEAARRVDCGHALIGPGFIDLDALSDLDTTVLAFDNQPGWRKGRVWPLDYMRVAREMYTPEELAWQKRYAFTRLIRNGVTTALPIASLFYRDWGETWSEFASAAEVAEELGLRAYLGPAYRSGNSFVQADGTIDRLFDEERGLEGLAEAERFCRAFENRAGGLIRTMLAPDRIETCTPELIRRSGALARARRAGSAALLPVAVRVRDAAIPADAARGCVWRAGAAVVEGDASYGQASPSRGRVMSTLRLPLSTPEDPARPTPGHGVRALTRCPEGWAPGHDGRTPAPGTTSPSPGVESPGTARAAAPKSSAPARPSPARPGTAHSRAAGTGR